jgi:hypothetical protein
MKLKLHRSCRSSQSSTVLTEHPGERHCVDTMAALTNFAALPELVRYMAEKV